MKMRNKIFLLIFFIIILISNLSLASYSTVTMSVVEEPVCTIDIGENSSFEKKLIEKNLSNKEVTLQLKVTNNEVSKKLTGEAIFVIDNSDSMNEKVDVTSSTTRKDLVFSSAKSLISTLLSNNEDLKIGIVSFSSNPDYTKEGTLEDATLVSSLSSDVDTLTNSIDNIQASGARTDLDAGLNLAKQQFTDSASNKYMIVLTDGVPNIALNYDNIYYSDSVISITNNTLKTIEESEGIQLFTMLTGIENEDFVPIGDKTYGQIIEEIFGTQDAPTAGKFYYITDDKITETISNSIYNDLLPESASITDITVIDYFPKEIIDNFEFAYVTEATHGNISASVDTTNNSITWTIPELPEGETAIVQYKLKLKENFDSSIVDKILDTNEKVDIDYTKPDGTSDSKTSDVTPKLKLTEPPVETPVKPPLVLPNAGKTAFVGFIVLASGLVIFSTIKLFILYKKTH